MARASESEHYVNNRQFTDAVRAWVLSYREAIAAGKEPPQVSDYIAGCFYSIAVRYSRKSNWSGYTYKDDMISEAVFLCIKYAHNFKPEFNNAFAYFTQYCKNAFIQYVSKEKKYAKFKFQLAKESSDKLEKMDWNNIDLDRSYDEDNAGFHDVEVAELEILTEQFPPADFIEEIEEETEEEVKESTDENL